MHIWDFKLDPAVTLPPDHSPSQVLGGVACTVHQQVTSSRVKLAAGLVVGVVIWWEVEPQHDVAGLHNRLLSFQVMNIWKTKSFCRWMSLKTQRGCFHPTPLYPRIEEARQIKTPFSASGSPPKNNFCLFSVISGSSCGPSSSKEEADLTYFFQHPRYIANKYGHVFFSFSQFVYYC